MTNIQITYEAVRGNTDGHFFGQQVILDAAARLTPHQPKIKRTRLSSEDGVNVVNVTHREDAKITIELPAIAIDETRREADYRQWLEFGRSIDGGELFRINAMNVAGVGLDFMAELEGNYTMSRHGNSGCYAMRFVCWIREILDSLNPEDIEPPRPPQSFTIDHREENWGNGTLYNLYANLPTREAIAKNQTNDSLFPDGVGYQGSLRFVSRVYDAGVILQTPTLRLEEYETTGNFEARIRWGTTPTELAAAAWGAIPAFIPPARYFQTAFSVEGDPPGSGGGGTSTNKTSYTADFGAASFSGARLFNLTESNAGLFSPNITTGSVLPDGQGYQGAARMISDVRDAGQILQNVSVTPDEISTNNPTVLMRWGTTLQQMQSADWLPVPATIAAVRYSQVAVSWA